jgi:hypothetical protein
MSGIKRVGTMGTLLRRGSARPLAILWLALVQLTGCALHGPDAMRASRLGYNEAVQVSERRELLLNLVRLRYTDAPEFLAISGISTQMNFEAGASIGGEFGEVEQSDSAFVTPGASVGFSETPTITFMPQRDQEFTRQLVASVELDSVYLLTQYGWGIDRVLRLVARRVNGLENTISREARRASQEDSLKAFGHVTSLLRRLEDKGFVSITVEQRRNILSAPIPADSVTPDDLLSAADAGYRLEFQESPPAYVLSGSQQHYVLRVSEDAWDDAEFVQVVRSLGLPMRQTTYDIDPGVGGFSSDTSDGRLRIETRSVLGTMAYLSNAVSVPDAHENQGLVSASSKIEPLVHDLLKIHVSVSPVENAYLAVPYREHWFYVDDSDLATKRTLGLLSSLIRLTISAGGAQNVPILTLPLTR